MRHVKILVPFLLSIVSMHAYSIDRSSEITVYVTQYQNNDLVAQKKITESLAWQGITDERVYDEIERLLLGLYKTHNGDRLKSDSVSWFIKALGFSGNPKYIATLKKIESEGVNRTHQKYIDESLSLLPEYTQWNKIINDESRWNTQESDVVNRYANMIQSDSLKLKEMAAKRIYNEQISSKYLLDIVEKELLAHYSEPHDKQNFANTYGYMSKALAANGNGQYFDTIMKVKKEGGSRRLRKMAQRHLSEFPAKALQPAPELTNHKEVPLPLPQPQKQKDPNQDLVPASEYLSSNSINNVNSKKSTPISDAPKISQEKSLSIKEQPTDLATRLQILKDLYDQGLIDKTVFEEKKRSIISEL